MPGFPKVLQARRGGVPRAARRGRRRRPSEITPGHRRAWRGRGPRRRRRELDHGRPRRARRGEARRALRRQPRRLRRAGPSSPTPWASTCSSAAARSRATRRRGCAQARSTRMRAGGIWDHLRRRLPPLLDRRALARAPLREDALRQRAAPAPLRRRIPRASATRRYAETAREIARVPLRARCTSPGGRLLRDAGRRQRGGRGQVLRLDARRSRRGARGDDVAATRPRAGAAASTERGQLRGERARRVLSRPAPRQAWPRSSDSPARRSRRRSREPSETLFAAREERPRPFRDEKVLASWNGLVIGALADGRRARSANLCSCAGRARLRASSSESSSMRDGKGVASCATRRTAW